MEYSELNSLAVKSGVKVKDRGNGHFQLTGIVTVNYYPNSKKKTAYITATKKGKTHVTAKQAVEMAKNLPPIIKGKPRRWSLKAKKKKLLKRSTVCHWCGEPLTEQTATVDHVVPLKRGGLNNLNNMVLACEPCNSKRGHDMPELTEQVD